MNNEIAYSALVSVCYNEECIACDSRRGWVTCPECEDVFCVTCADWCPECCTGINWSA